MKETHSIIKGFYVGDVKVRTLVTFCRLPDYSCGFNCNGMKKVHIYHKLRAGFYQSDCESGCECIFKSGFNCVDDILSIVEDLYPDYQIFGNKDYFKKHFRRKKCVDADVCPREKSQEER